MAVYKTDIVDIELNSGSIHRSFLTRTIGEGDDLANRFGIRAFRNGVPETLGGSCAGYFIRADGETVAVQGVVSGNMAYVQLPATCYAVEGQFALVIKVTSSSVTGTLRIIDGVVCNTTTSVIVDPGTIIPSISDLIDDIEEAVASLPADYSSIWDSLAPEFSTAENYSVGDMVTYDGQVFRFTAEHSGTWDAEDAEAISLGQELSAAMQLQRGQALAYAVTHADGYDIYELAELIPAGTPVTIRVNLSSEETDPARTSKIRAVNTVYSQQISLDRNVSRDTDHYLMFTAEYPVKKIYLMASNNTEASAGLSLTVNAFDIRYGHKVIADEFDASEGIVEMLTNYGECRLDTGEYTVEVPFKMPDGSVLRGSGVNTVLMLAGELPEASFSKSNMSATGYVPYKTNGEDAAHQMPELMPGLYKYTVNVSVTGEAGQRSYIRASSKTTYDDDVADISVIRGQNNVGYFFAPVPVKSIYVLAGVSTSMEATVTVNSLTVERVQCIGAMGSMCGIDNLRICGYEDDITQSTTLGSRNGIAWTGGDVESGYITRCTIDRFDGCGIMCAETTTEVFRGLRISDCYIRHNGCGIFTAHSEYNKISNCVVTWNGYGMINRGGNNAIGNCGFDRNLVGIEIDEDSSSNAGHGQITGCTLNHSDGNTGYGLIIRDTGRMVVTGCQFFYSSVKLQDTNGNVISGCEFGSSADVEIVRGEMNMLIGCGMFNATQNHVRITDNPDAKVINCYYRAGGEVVPTEVTT